MFCALYIRDNPAKKQVEFLVSAEVMSIPSCAKRKIVDLLLALANPILSLLLGIHGADG